MDCLVENLKVFKDIDCMINISGVNVPFVGVVSQINEQFVTLVKRDGRKILLKTTSIVAVAETK